jgi:hypothetical protein
MPVVEAVQTFVGIVNENEFYSHRNLSEWYSGPSKAVTADRAWRRASATLHLPLCPLFSTIAAWKSASESWASYWVKPRIGQSSGPGVRVIDGSAEAS